VDKRTWPSAKALLIALVLGCSSGGAGTGILGAGGGGGGSTELADAGYKTGGGGGGATGAANPSAVGGATGRGSVAGSGGSAGRGNSGSSGSTPGTGGVAGACDCGGAAGIAGSTGRAGAAGAAAAGGTSGSAGGGSGGPGGAGGGAVSTALVDDDMSDNNLSVSNPQPSPSDMIFPMLLQDEGVAFQTVVSTSDSNPVYSDLAAYTNIIWYTGAARQTIFPVQQQVLEQWLDTGGKRLVIFSENLTGNLGGGTWTTEANVFLGTYVGATGSASDVYSYVQEDFLYDFSYLVTGSAGTPFQSMTFLVAEGTQGTANVDLAQQIFALHGVSAARAARAAQRIAPSGFDTRATFVCIRGPTASGAASGGGPIALTAGGKAKNSGQG
jgi:hypothetical protein